ncbi:MAG: YeeE/YedE family protein [Candidatus Kapabacteria bacterium]|nr:YeeE/YedE family protein [Ignavibacteriota bacterium]MCW5884818.1 YeeE/YedE family protein [Candidatus Kapabacteria bacterium]
MLEFIKQPWTWYVAGPMITLVMFLMLYLGKNFGVSSTMRTICASTGAGKFIPFFNFKWKEQLWNIFFVVGMILGGLIASTLLSSPEPVQISEQATINLMAMGISSPGTDILPAEIFSWESLMTFKGFTILVVGGFLVGFGARWAGGCTSGHAISGLSNLQLPSLIAVAGFFIGGLVMTYFMLPLILRTGI